MKRKNLGIPMMAIDAQKLRLETFADEGSLGKRKDSGCYGIDTAV